MGKKDKKAAPAPPEAEPEEIPISSAPLPLLKMDARTLGEFFELTFPDKRLLELCGELRLYSPGYRIEAMPPDQVARMLADEVREAKDAEQLVEKAVREALRNPVLEGKPMSEEHYRDLLELFSGDPLQHVARLAWRSLIDDDEKLRGHVPAIVAFGIELLDAPSRAAKEKPRKPQLSTDVQELRKKTEDALKEAERAAKERDSLREQLAQSRAETVEREKTLAEVRDELTQVRGELTRASAELARLTAAGEGRALADARRLADENRSLSEKLRTALEERDALRDQLKSAQRAAPVAPQPAPVSEDDALPSAEEAATFLIPIFTREFYDSIQRWDRRMQRAAFDKVSLLARDWRHGSLRALALEGLPGYYRIRIATDVRLIYRRGEGNTLEILSLIDREDLDRYIRQARTR
jgi:hypothetical protein